MKDCYSLSANMVYRNKRDHYLVEFCSVSFSFGEVTGVILKRVSSGETFSTTLKDFEKSFENTL